MTLSVVEIFTHEKFTSLQWHSFNHNLKLQNKKLKLVNVPCLFKLSCLLVLLKRLYLSSVNISELKTEQVNE